MERINSIMDVMIKAITLLTFFIVFLSFISYYLILKQYDLISIMTDNGFDYIRVIPVIIPSFIFVFSFFIFIEGATFFISFFSKDTNLVSFDSDKIDYSKLYISLVVLIFLFSCLFFYFVLTNINVDVDFLGIYISLFIFVFSVFFGFWYYKESNKRKHINIKYQNNISGALGVFVTTFCVCFLLFFLSVILFISFGDNENKYYYLLIVFFVSLFVLVNYFINLSVLNNYKENSFLLKGFCYKTSSYLFFIFVFGFLLTNVAYFINHQSYVKAGYIIMNNYEYSFENGIPHDFLIYDVKIGAFSESKSFNNYGFDSLHAYPYVGCILFKKCTNSIGNDIDVLQRLISVVKEKNNTISVLGVFTINGKTLICPKKLGVDIQNERRVNFGFNFEVKKINYKKECLFIDNNKLI